MFSICATVQLSSDEMGFDSQNFGGIDKCLCVFAIARTSFGRLTSEAVEGAALALEGVHDIHGGDGLPASVLGVGDGITDHVLKEHLEDGAGLLVDEARDALDATTTRETADGRLGDALDVITKDLAVTLGAALSESFSSFSTARHIE